MASRRLLVSVTTNDALADQDIRTVEVPSVVNMWASAVTITDTIGLRLDKTVIMDDGTANVSAAAVGMVDTDRDQLVFNSIVERLESIQTAMVQQPEAVRPNDDVTQLTDDLRQLADDVARLDHEFKDVLQAVAEGIERTERAERRIQQTVKRARKELKERDLEDPGLEAEHHQLRLSDGDRGAGDGLRALPANVEPAAEEASSIKGVSVAVLQRARGF